MTSISTTNEYEVRCSKRRELIAMSIPPYASKWHKTHNIQALRDHGEQDSLRSIEEILDKPQQLYSTAGRLMLKRISGKLAFAQLQDETGIIQVMFEYQHSKLLTQPQHGYNTPHHSDKPFDYIFLDKFLDVGDWIGVKGELFITHKGELTLFVSDYQLLSKTLRPLGDKRHGIGEDNQEKAYRQRYLDMTLNRDTLERMKLRSKFLKTIREFYRSQGFIELDTPILGNSASGAAATPFVTHHEDFDAEMYLRIAPEIALKIATAGGLEKVFEIAKDFRNEGSSPAHHQEFTAIEHYSAYWNFEDNMYFTEQMFDYIFSQLPELSQTVMIADKEGVEREVNFQTPRQRIDYIAQIQKDSGIDVSLYSAEDSEKLRSLIRSQGFDREGLDTQTTATMIDYLYKKVTRPKIIGPAFIVNYPKTMQPLARQSDQNPQIVEQFQVIVNGWEIVKAYSELVDPIIQQQNFDEQSGAVDAGDSEATKSDDEFVLAMEHGMPCQSGRGMGVDRILAMLTRQSNIRDVIMFPMMKKELNIESGKSKDIIKSSKGVILLVCGLTGSGKSTAARYIQEKTGFHLLVSDQIRHQVLKNGSQALNLQTQEIAAYIKNYISQYKDDSFIVDSTCFMKSYRDELIHFGKQIGYDILILKVTTTHDDLNIQRIEGRKNDNIHQFSRGSVADYHRIKENRDPIEEKYSEIDNSGTLDELYQKIDTFLEEHKLHQNISASLQTGVLLVYGNLPTRAQADSLASKYLAETLLHCQQVAQVMEKFALKLGENQDLRYMVGLLHDVDRDYIKKDSSTHLKDEFDRMMDEIDVPQLMRDDIKSHGERLTGVPVDSRIRKYLASIDELSGFLYAYSRMRPTAFDGMEVSGVKKRLKDKAFAAGVDRDHVMNCEKYLDIPFDEFCKEVIEYMK